MISRRNALKLGAAGLAAPLLSASPVRGLTAFGQESLGSVPTFRGNAARTGEMPGPAPDPMDQITVKWSFHAESPGSYQPAVSNGKVIFGTESSYESSRGEILVLDSVSGDEILRSPNTGFWGRSPTIVDDIVYVEDYFGLSAWDIVRNQEEWYVRSDYGFITQPAVVEGAVYIASLDGNAYAFDTVQGDEIWRLSTGESFGFESTGPKSPAVTDDAVYITSLNHDLYAINASSGLELWHYSRDSGLELSTPAVEDGVVYINIFADSLIALDAQTGEELWRFPVFSYSTPAVADGLIYIGSVDGKLYAVEADTGTGYSIFSAGDSIFSSCAIVDSTLFFGSDDNNFYAINRETGEELWRLVTKGAVRSFPAVVNGVVFVSSDDNNLYAIGNGVPSELIPVLVEDVVVRGSPTSSGVERGDFSAGTEVTTLGGYSGGDGKIWREVHINSTTGWIPLDSIDSASLPPDGIIEQNNP